jgi:hypothetical protein
MRVSMLQKPSTAVVMGGLALFVAFSGTGFAAVSALDGHKLLDRSVTHVKITKNTLTGTEINERRLGKVPRATLADKANRLPAARLRTLTVGTGWASATALTNRDLGFRKDAQGFVHLQGALTRSTGVGMVMATLPRGFRPYSYAYFPVFTKNGQLGSVQVAGDGTITLFDGDPAYVSLEGVVFSVDALTAG